MSAPWRDRAFTAHAVGDPDAARTALLEGGRAILGDSPALQLRAIVADCAVDEHAIFAHAALDVEPHDANAFFNLGVVDQQMGDVARAHLRYEQALRIDPHHPGALNNLSDLLRRAHRSQEAWDAIQRYLALGGNPDGLEIRIAKIADDCGLVDQARTWFARAVEREPGNADIIWEHAIQQLRDEEFAAGWRGYEQRRGKFPHEALAIVRYAMPEWDGGALRGRSLLVHKEQGLGDTIMFASCLADLPRDGRALHLAVHPALTRLFAANFPDAQVWSSLSTAQMDDARHQKWLAVAGPIDLQIPFGSLPLHLRTGGFATPRPYLAPRPEDREVWRRRLPQLMADAPGNLRAGIVFSARRNGAQGPGIAEGHSRSLPPHLLYLLDRPDITPGITWIGLHDRANAPEYSAVPHLRIINSSDWIYDLADTAALIAELDVVVAVDTSVAHLAGAMGKTVLLALPRRGDWRWGRDRRGSYWYGDVEIFRQEHEGDWGPVLQAIAGRLAGMVAARAEGARP